MMAAEAIGTGTLIALGDANAFTSPSGDAGIFVANLCGTRRETSTAVSCTPAGALVGTIVTCTSTVADDGVGEPQTLMVPIPAGGTITLLDGDGDPATSVTFPGQGAYALEATSGTITFTPAAGFTGTARGVAFRLTDAYGQSSDAAFTATVAVTTPAPTTAEIPAGTTPTAAPAAPAAAATPAPVVCVSRRAVTIHFRLPAAGRTLTAQRIYETCAVVPEAGAPATLYLRGGRAA